MSERGPQPSQELALFDGGPIVGALRWARLRGESVRDLCWRRVYFLVALTWLPLLLLSALEGQALGELTRIPFLLDASVHVRFLLALPLLILAEIDLDERVRTALGRFVTREIVPPAEIPRFAAALARGQRRLGSWVAEALMLLLVLSLAAGQLATLVASDAPLAAGSWHMLSAAEGTGRSPAGLWFALVSLPIFQLVTLRWYYRILVWAGVMWRISRLPLNLVPANPDRVAGLGFLGQTINGYLPLALAHGAMLSAVLVNQIFYAGATLGDFAIETVVMVVFVFCLVLGPLAFFVPALVAAERRGTESYGALGNDVARAFHRRWLDQGSREHGELLEVGEVSTMADLDATLGIIREMRYVPITREALIWLALAVLAPIAPLLLTVMPAEEWLKALAGVLF